jgi:hypothetical protein
MFKAYETSEIQEETNWFSVLLKPNQGRCQYCFTSEHFTQFSEQCAMFLSVHGSNLPLQTASVLDCHVQQLFNLRDARSSILAFSSKKFFSWKQCYSVWRLHSQIFIEMKWYSVVPFENSEQIVTCRVNCIVIFTDQYGGGEIKPYSKPIYITTGKIIP